MEEGMKHPCPFHGSGECLGHRLIYFKNLILMDMFLAIHGEKLLRWLDKFIRWALRLDKKRRKR